MAHDHTHEHTHDGVAHTHEHTHDGVAHTHFHSHAHSDGHEHTHSHDTMEGDKILALLTYMLDHNVHHCSELKELEVSLSGEAAHMLYHAVEAFDKANGYLSKTIEELKK